MPFIQGFYRPVLIEADPDNNNSTRGAIAIRQDIN
jgi:hypothetical protein